MALRNHRVLVTGANGFIAKNLISRLHELPQVSVTAFVRGDDPSTLPLLVSQVDSVVHLAGENRPSNEQAFFDVNSRLTSMLCDALKAETTNLGRNIPVILASSSQAGNNTPYGLSKLEAENSLRELAKATSCSCSVFRLPGVFGKWCKHDYNSVVATFCHNIARGRPIKVIDPNKVLRLVYIDDVVSAFIRAIVHPKPGFKTRGIEPEYLTTPGEIAKQIRAFHDGRLALKTERVGSGLSRALYATFLSHLPKESFSYEITSHSDSRGVFVEMLKTPDCGQVSFFTAYPGMTRGEHYHHTKTEKFLVIKGKASFRFRHIVSNEIIEFQVSGNKPSIIDTIPGWSHSVTNVGDDEMIVLLWANETFDQSAPDTVKFKV